VTPENVAGGDRIELRGLRVLGTHGVLAEEQARAQPFEIDLDVDVDLRAAGASDRLDDTLDYSTLAATAATIVAGERHALLERVAQRIAEALLEDGRVRSVAVTVRKLRPPVPVDLATSAVRVVRP
jgi:7,8-dihydroneopterin aldolase/epimerase/oxygenase